VTAAALLAALLAQEVDLSKVDAACGVLVRRKDDTLRAEWTADGDARFSASFSVAPNRPLLRSLEAGGAEIARDLKPIYLLTVGSRTERANERYIFFDKPSTRPHQRHAAELDFRSVRAESRGRRLSIAFSKLSAGPFSGDLVVTIYAGSPLLHVEAVMGVDQRLVAYIYDFVLEGSFERFAWRDPQDRFARAAPEGEPRPIAVRHRTIMAESDRGTVALFPPPHAFFFPRDHTDNFAFVQAGGSRFGLRQDADKKNAFVPWFDAPAGRPQRMGAFVLLSAAKAEETLERVKRYTNSDAFRPMDGRRVFTSHWHSRLSVSEMQGRPRAPEFVRVFKGLGVDIVHLAEFHGDGSPADPGPKRLPELKAMFDVCRKYSDDKLLLLPGEEANARLNQPAPPKTHAGHWVYLFPRPVYLTLAKNDDKPFSEELAPFGTVYHARDEADMFEILRRENGLGWTAHPRIKASFACPDSYREKDWYKSDRWLGGAWKAMPGDLSLPRLGVRVLDLLDDMNTWGQRKFVPGEVDCFEIDSTHEMYGHMNVNYLRLPKNPTVDDWSPVLECLRRGDFFVTTGEVLIHGFGVEDGKISAEIEWTFPLGQIEIVECDGRAAKRRTIFTPDAAEFERRRFEWPLENKDAAWVRLEAWDVSVNGAFTQPLWREDRR
jgi:hypothetical protein